MTQKTEGRGGRPPWRWPDGQAQWLRYLLLLLAVGVVLLSMTDRGAREVDAELSGVVAEPGTASEPGVDQPYARAMERLVQDALMQLHGVQRVHVAVTLAGGPRKVLAETVTTERRVNDGQSAGDGGGKVTDERSSSQPVLVRNDQGRQENPVVLVEYLPAIEGVVVVTDAASDSRVRLEIARAVATLLGVAAHRVYVLPQQFD